MFSSKDKLWKLINPAHGMFIQDIWYCKRFYARKISTTYYIGMEAYDILYNKIDPKLICLPTKCMMNMLLCTL